MLIPQAPENFDGDLEQFFQNYAQSVLPCPAIVEEFHHKLISYLKTDNPVFLTRKIRDQVRGEVFRLACGHQIKPTDNSPAWYIHYHLFSHNYALFADFPNFIGSIPCHMFHIELPETINGAGWHVAHLFNVNNRNVDYQIWNRDELVRRTVRNIHPCNHFYIPKPGWQIYGGNPDVLAFFQEKLSHRYRSVWNEFLSLADAAPYTSDPENCSHCIHIKGKETCKEYKVIGTAHCDVKYTYSRFCFKANIIEPLGMNQMFCMCTPDGVFAMTKKEFYDAFPNVVASRCYRNDGIFHSRRPPAKALQFRIE